MEFRATDIAGVTLIVPSPQRDVRGAFTRLFCAETFRQHGLPARFDQISSSLNLRVGTLRGLHLQRPPHAEHKLVRVDRGAIFDVAVDGRAGSPTYGRWQAFELTADNQHQLYLPPGVLHGFQTVAPDTLVVYAMHGGFVPAAQDGATWDDPDLAIAWPDPAGAILSERDRTQPAWRAFTPVVMP